MILASFMNVDPGAWWEVIEVIATKYWSKALLLIGAYAAYRLILAMINRSGG